MPEDSYKRQNKKERRQSDRKKLIVDVHFEGGDATAIANTTDISLGGLFLKTNTPLEIGTKIIMRLTLGGKEVVFDGDVIYAEAENGYGIEFQNLTDEKITILKNELNLE